MAYTPSTKLTDLVFFQVSTPDAPNPRLASPIDEDDTTIYFTVPLLDKDGAVITGNTIISVKNSSSYTENIYLPAASVAGDGYSASGVIRGIRTSGLDFTTGDSNFAASHEQDSPFVCAVSAVYESILNAVLRGASVATGGLSFILGDATNSTVTIKQLLNGSTVGWLRRNFATSKVEFSNDGAVWEAISDAVASVTVKVSAADTTAGYLSDKLVSATGGIDFNILNGGGNETLNLTVDLSEAGVIPGPLAGVVSNVTSTAAEVNKLNGTSANVTAANLNTLTAGATSNADALHTHINLGSLSLTAGEAIDGSVSAVPVSQMNYGYDGIGIGREGTNSWGSAAVSFGNADASTWTAQSFTYTNAKAKSIKLRRVITHMRAGAVADNVTANLYTNVANLPVALVANGASDAVAGAGLSAGANRFVGTTFTFAVNPTITSGTKYSIVFKRSAANDAANYYEIRNLNVDVYGGHGRNDYTASTLTWSAENANDLVLYVEFEIDGQGVIYKTDSDNVDTLNFVGFTKSNVAAAATATVLRSGVINTLAGLTANKSVYGATAPGTYTQTEPTTAGTANILIGVADSTTSLLVEDNSVILGNTVFMPSTNGGVTLTQIDYGRLTAGTVDYFVKTGFKPREVSITLSLYTNGALTIKDYLTIRAFSNGQVINRFVTSGTTMGFDASVNFKIQSFAENGFFIRIAGINADVNAVTELTSWTAIS